MKLTESKLRSIIQEELNIQSSGRLPPKYSVQGGIQIVMKRAFKYFESQLKSAYDIEFDDVYETDRQLSVMFEVYNRRQDMMKEGRILMFEVDKEVELEIRAKQIGYDNLGPEDTIYENTFDPKDDLTAIDIVSIFQTVAGRS